MKNFDQSVKINLNLNWNFIPDHPYQVLVIGGSEARKNNLLLNLIKYQPPYIGKTYLSKTHSIKSINCLLIEENEWELEN